MRSLVFVCTGNICRSPFAERLTRMMLEVRGNDEWQVSSLGVQAMSGHPMESLMEAELGQRGGSSAGFLARQATFDRLEEANLIIAMTASHREWVLEEAPALLNRTFTLGQAVRFVEENARGIYGDEFLTQLGKHRSRARRRDDVSDPYRRGPDAAAKAATTITDLLAILVPHLLREPS